MSFETNYFTSYVILILCHGSNLEVSSVEGSTFDALVAQDRVTITFSFTRPQQLLKLSFAVKNTGAIIIERLMDGSGAKGVSLVFPSHSLSQISIRYCSLTVGKQG